MTVAEAKAELRRTMRLRLKGMAPADRATASARIGEQVRAAGFWRAARTVLCYAPMLEEVDVWPLLAVALGQGKRVALPRFTAQVRSYVAAQVQDLERDVVAGEFGIREPAAHCPELELADVDMMLVPGLAFDATGRRLGRGKGFYDRWLAGFPGMTCGVALAEQMVAEIPVSGHDIPMRCVVTPAGVVWPEPH